MAWGHKYTISVYIEGTDAAKTQEWMVAMFENMMLPPGTEFVGMKLEGVEDAPQDQVAT